MAGRGRGRGRGLLQTTSPAPGNLQNRPSERGDERRGMDEIERLLGEVNLNIEEDSLNRVHVATEKFVKDKDHLQQVCDLIYKMCIVDREWTKCGTCVCDRLQDVEVSGTKFRNIILATVQKDFKEKDELRTKNLKRYLGFVTFLCQLYLNMRLKQGTTLDALVNPIFDCLELSIGAAECSDDELETIALQLQAIGKEMYSKESRMTTLSQTIRQKIIQDGTTARGRCILLEVLECYLRQWKKMPNDITLFYCDTMADVLAGMIL